MESKNKFTAKHFIMIPFEDQNFLDQFNKYCDLLKAKNPKNFDENLLQKASKLHMSVVILDLKEDPEKINKIKEILKEAQPKLKELANGGITFKFEKYDVFDSISKTRVVFAKMFEDESYTKLQYIVDYILKQLVNNNIIENKDLSNLHITPKKVGLDNLLTIEFHLTLLNTTFLNKTIKNKKKTVKNFDSTDILTVSEGFVFNECPLNKIDFCVMREDKSIGKYELVESYSIN